MALNKITDAQMTAYGVTSAPDKLTGTAAENKALFDRLIRQVVAARYNALVDALQAVTGAGEIGAGVDGIDGSTVQAILTALKALRDSDVSGQGATNTSVQSALENRYTKDQTDTLLSAKFDTVKANELVKTIQFNGDTGVFTITTQGGIVTTIDTLLEKVPAAFSLEGNKLVLTLEDGTKQEADLSAFIDTYKSEAISAAAADATTKANTAQSNAVASAKTYTDTEIGKVNTNVSANTSAISTLTTNKANKATSVTATILAANWSDTSYILSVTGVTETSNQEILPAIDITAEQLEALQAANIQDGGQAAGSITLKAFGDVPTIDIPVRVIVRGDA